MNYDEGAAEVLGGLDLSEPAEGRSRPRRTLAIHGGRPAFEQELHVGTPNIGDPERYRDLLDGMLRRRRFTNDGPLVREFEARLAAHVGVRHVVAICNGTLALEVALRASGATGEVIVPSYTFVASAHAVHWQGLTPVFADIDPFTHCLDPEAVIAKITPRTSAIIATHLWGRPAPVEALEAIARERGLTLIFDAAHAFGVSHGGRMIGNFGTCEVYSFHATKFLNSLEGGAIATNDDRLAKVARLMRNFGFAGFDDVVQPGTNGKMVEACAAMGIANLEVVDALIARNRANYEAYRCEIDTIGGLRLLDMSRLERGNYQYVVVEVGDGFGASRDAIVDALQAERVIARRYFWPGCHRMKPYADLFPEAAASLPHTEAVAARVFVLPTGTAVSGGDIAKIGQIIRLVRDHAARGRRAVR
jgi:dTDP-4-amino-4,6-dideoxygalactose transaminase